MGQLDKACGTWKRLPLIGWKCDLVQQTLWSHNICATNLVGQDSIGQPMRRSGTTRFVATNRVGLYRKKKPCAMWSRASIFPMVQKISIYLITKSRWLGWGGGWRTERYVHRGGLQIRLTFCSLLYGTPAPSSESQLLEAWPFSPMWLVENQLI